MNSDNGENIGLFCGICGNNHLHTQCTYIQITSYIFDNIVPSKARLTLPNNLRIEKMSEGSEHIVATDLIKKGTQFGPFEAKKLFTLDPEVVFPLKIFTPNEYFTEYYLDTNNENDCNWMMFISPALNIEEQNLICYQEEFKIYYISLRDIARGEFLKVWYAPFYAKKMNKNILTQQNETTEVESLDLNSLLKKQQNLMERDTWTCKFCSMQEKDVTKFAQHISEHYSMQVRKVCEICKSAFTTHKGLKKHRHIVHADVSNIQVKNKKDNNNIIHNERNMDKDLLLGGPLLNDILADSMDNANLLFHHTEIGQFDMSNIENDNILLENENLNLGVENLLTENDNFNFDIGEDREQHICDICLKSFSKLKFLLQHLKKHTGKYTCTECLTIFCRNENLKAHICNYKKPQHSCTLCQKLFSQKKYLSRHMQSVHEKRHQCQRCEKSYHCDKEFREHNCPSVPDSEKDKYPCSLCNKVFYRESYMKKHVNKVHTPKKSVNKTTLICEICAKTFHHLRYLEQHKKTHLDTSYLCKLCDKSFSRTDALKNHIDVSHSSKFYQCTICDKKCKTKRYLQIHMLIHSDKKKFKCDVCDQQFVQKSNLVTHQRKKHCSNKESLDKQIQSNLNYYYECPLCKKIFKLRSSLIRHIKKAHPDEVINTSTIKKIPNANIIDKQPEEKTNAINLHSARSLQQENNFTNKLNDNRNDDSLVPELDNYLCLKNKTSSSNMPNIDNLTSNFENIVNTYNASNILETNYNSSVFSKDDMNITVGNEEKTNETILDFHNIELDLDVGFNISQDLNINNQEVCLSMPELNDLEQDITLGENAYMLDNGTIVEPLEQGNVVVYILDKKYSDENQSS